MNISILTPTRVRPSSIDRLVMSCLKMATDPTKIEFVFYIDNDDNASKEKLEELKVKISPEQIKYLQGPRIVLSEMWNQIQPLATADIFMHCGDDIVFQTQGWDDKVLEAFNKSKDKIIFVHGNDGYWNERFGTHGFLHKNWVNVCGYFVPPYFSSDYNDTWLNDVSNILNKRVHVDIYTEHMHQAFGKATFDSNHLDRLARHRKDNVDALYHSEKMVQKRSEDAEKLKNFINSYEA